MSQPDLPIIEPFRIKSVEPIRMTTREERERHVAEAEGNLFRIPAKNVLIDLLTDSGTGAMSSAQWGAVLRGDESYAGSPSYERFEQSVHELFGFEHVIPTHQGRAAEHILFQTLGGPGLVFPNNTHFDTTRANIESTGAAALDLPCAESADTRSTFPFKGNMDLDALEGLLEREKGNVPLVMMTVTNNGAGGQAVAIDNLRAVRAICDSHGVPLFIDACRFAENAWLVKQRDPAWAEKDVREIVRATFEVADGCTMSAKKDGLANIGGFLAVRDRDLARELRQRLVVTEGFPTYGGMSGRDLEAVAQGLTEVIEEDYLAYRQASIAYVCDRLDERGIPVVLPAGGHAIFLDAARFLPHVPWSKFPGQALAIELYLEGGIRSCEIGSLMMGRKDEDGNELPAAHELVRLAIPRRTYTQSHMDYLIAIIERVWQRRSEIGGVEITFEPPVLRHFGASFRSVPAAQPEVSGRT
ncbi:MAG TPA: tryptophanase [Planctomycetes bacterium]|nr:tryptophanase [Planctomycetota bacterium]